MRVVVIGASAAGGSLCETVRSLDPSAEIQIITDEALPLYSRCLLPMYVDGDKSREDLSFRPGDWRQQFRIEAVNQRAARVLTEAKQVELSNGERVPYDVLGLATGASAVIPELPGISCKGVFALYTLASADAIKTWLPRVRRVAVLGAGFIGMKSAEALRRLGKEVVIIVRRTHVLPNHLDDGAAAIVTRLLAEKGVQVVTRQVIEEVVSNDQNELVALRMSTGETIDCQMLICASGTHPNMDFLQGSGITIGQAVTVGEHLETSIPGIFAMGDVAEAAEISSPGRMAFANWRNAVREGRIAAYNMLGERTPYTGRLRANAARLFGLPVVVVGRPLADDGDSQILEKPDDLTYQKLVFHDGRLTGMIMVGDVAEAGALTSLMQLPRDLDSVRDRLLEERAGCLPDLTLAASLRRPS